MIFKENPVKCYMLWTDAFPQGFNFMGNDEIMQKLAFLVPIKAYQLLKEMPKESTSAAYTHSKIIKNMGKEMMEYAVCSIRPAKVQVSKTVSIMFGSWSKVNLFPSKKNQETLE
jgi:hypothetical protein